MASFFYPFIILTFYYRLILMLLLVFFILIYNFTFITNMTCITYILPQHVTLLSHLIMFFFIHSLYCHSPCIYLLYDFIVFRLVSYHIDVAVVQRGT
jgi:hypothetical protein